MIIKSKTKKVQQIIIPVRDLKITLDLLLSQIESIKVDLDLDRIFTAVGKELQKMKIGSIISILDGKKQRIVIKHIDIEGDDKLFFPPDKIKSIDFSKLVRYQAVLKKRRGIFYKNEISQFKNFLQTKTFLDRIGRTNSIITPLILKREVIGFFEVFSSNLQPSDVKTVEEFSQKLTGSIANVILCQRVQESEERYHNLFEKAQEGFLILNGREKRFIDVNRKLCEISGYSRAELLKMNYLLLIAPEERKRVDKYVKQRLNGNFGTKNAPMNYETIFLTEKGERRFVRIRVIQVLNKDEWFTIIEDITERKQVEEALRESEEKYRKLIDNANDGVIIIDIKRLITFANKAFCKISGYNKKDFANLHFSKIIHPDDYHMVVRRFKGRIKRKKLSPHFEARIINKKGGIRYISYSTTSIKRGEKLVGTQGIVRDITEEKKLQEKIEQTREHHGQVINTIQNGICVISKDFKIISCNQAFVKKVNLPISKIKGKNCVDVIPRYKNDLFRNHCSRLVCGKNCVVDKVLKNGKTVSFIEKDKDSSGKIYYHRISIFPAKDSKGQVHQVVFTIQDVTERKTAEEEIRRLNEFNKRILDNAPVSIMTLDRRGIITSENEYTKNLSKSKRHAGKSIFIIDFFKREDLVDKYKELLQTGKSFAKSNCQTINKEGKIKYLNIIAAPLKDKRGNINGAVSMAIDNTEAILIKKKIEKLNKELERKVIQRTRQLDQVNKELSKVLDLKSKFIADASHELRTPLTIIQGNLDLAAQEAKGLDNEVPEVFNLINKEVEQMSGILADLTMLTNTDANSEKLAYEEVNLGSLVKAASQSLKVLAQQKNIKIKYKKGLEKLSIMGDEAELEKLLLNIIRNAIKYNKEGGWVKIWLEKDKSEARIYIEDNGIGVPEKDLPYIFERFYCVDKARTGSEGGVGLGLAIAKWIVEAHKGKISVESILEQGSKFAIHLPYDYKKQREEIQLFS